MDSRRLIRCQESSVLDIINSHTESIAKQISEEVLVRFRDVIDDLISDKKDLEGEIEDLKREIYSLNEKILELKYEIREIE